MFINKINKNIFKNALIINYGYLEVIFPDKTEFNFGNKNSKINMIKSTVFSVIFSN